MITARRDGKYITRNISHFKVIDSSLKQSDEEEEEDEEDCSTKMNEFVPPSVIPVPPALPMNVSFKTDKSTKTTPTTIWLSTST